MSVNTISGNVAAVQMQPVKTTVAADKTVTGALASNDLQSIKAVLASPLDAATDTKRATAIRKTTEKSNVSNSQPAGIVSHVVESYNQYGKVRTKFMDSRNNVVYQTPSEMVAKIEDQMMTPNTSANVKG